MRAGWHTVHTRWGSKTQHICVSAGRLSIHTTWRVYGSLHRSQYSNSVARPSVECRQDGQRTKGPEYFRRNLAPDPNGSQSTRSNSKRSTVQQVCLRRGTNAADTAVGLPGSSHCSRFRLFGLRRTLRRMYSLPHNSSKQARCEFNQHFRFDRKSLMPTDISKHPFH